MKRYAIYYSDGNGACYYVPSRRDPGHFVVTYSDRYAYLHGWGSNEEACDGAALLVEKEAGSWPAAWRIRIAEIEER